MLQLLYFDCKRFRSFTKNIQRKKERGMVWVLGVRAGSHEVPSPTRVSMSQHGGEVPTFESWDTNRILLIIFKVGSWLFYAKLFTRLLLRVGFIFVARPNSQHNSWASPPKSDAMYASMSCLGLRTWDPMWSGKSQLPCSQRLRLHRLTSSDLGLSTWDHVWTNPKRG